MSRVVLTFLIACWTIAGSASAQTSLDGHDRAVRMMVRGLTLMEADDHEAALEILEMALKLAPEEPALLASLAEVHFALGDVSAALYFAAHAADRRPQNPELLLQLASYQQDAGDEDGAHRTFSLLTERFPHDVHVAAESARYLSKHGTGDEVRDVLTAALRRCGPDPRLLDAVMDVSQRLTIDVIGEILHDGMADTSEDQMEAYFVRDWFATHFDASAFDRLPPVLVTATHSTTEEPLAGALRHEDSESSPAHGPMSLETATYHEQRANDEPRNVATWISASWAYLQAGYPSEAVRVGSEALILFPANPHLLTATGAAMLELGRLGDAQRLLEVIPNDEVIPAIEALLAYIDAVNETQPRTRSLQDAEVLETAASILAYRAITLALSGDQDAGLIAARRAYQNAPHNPIVLESLGWVRFLHGDLSGAVELLSQAASIGEHRRRVKGRLAIVLEESGRTQEAQEIRAELDATP